jgi:ABC-type multidrug transport system fused ATPase/permease subunit
LTPGRRLALVGPSGAGKSTVAAVLFRFQELAGGCVTMDGHDLAGYRAQDVRSLIGGCPQDPHLFNASIAENLRLARPEAPDAALTAMIDRVGLAPWIAGLPHGMNTQVGFGGAAVWAASGSGSRWPGRCSPIQPS